MATAVVSGRVDAAIKHRADGVIRAAGLSAGDVVRAVWENIARTGEVPVLGAADDPEGSAPWANFMAFREQLPPAEPWLVGLTKDQARDMAVERHA